MTVGLPGSASVGYGYGDSLFADPVVPLVVAVPFVPLVVAETPFVPLVLEMPFVPTPRLGMWREGAMEAGLPFGGTR